MPSLRRDEAQTRAELISVDSYTVDLDLTRGDELFGSTATIRFRAADTGAATFFEVVPETLRRVVLNGTELPVADLADNRFPLSGLAAENELVVEADMSYSHSGEGLHRFTDPEDKLVYTYMMGFHDMASRVFGCFEQPDLKAPLTLGVTAPADWTVIANEDGEQVEPGRWVFTQTKALATYFTTLCAGPYHSVYREHDGVRFGLHCRQSMAEGLDTDADEIFEVSFGCFDLFQRLYGVRFPFGATYDQAFVPEFNAGAMENPGCVTFRDEAFIYRSAVTETRREGRATTIAHEMAHMWFGDLVTLRWWDDLWLNESFANYMGYRGAAEATRFEGGWANVVFNKLGGLAADQRPSTHPVSCELEVSADALANFDGIAYAKGGAILKQLAAWLGDDVFFAGLREYFDRYGFGNASLADFLDCQSKVSGHDLAEWGRSWLRTTGPNTLRAEVAVDGDGRYTSVAIRQTAPEGHPTLRSHHVKVGLYDLDGERMVRREQVTVAVSGELTEIPELEGVVKPALLLVNDDDLTYAKVRLDPDSLAAVRTALPALEDRVARALLWSIVWDSCRDAELPPGEFLALVRECLPSEPLMVVVEQLMMMARRIVIEHYVAPSARVAALRDFAELGRAIADGAEPGGGRQLSGLRAVIGASTGDDVPLLRGWLDGVDVPEGFVVDTEVRWQILTRLCVLGAAGEDDIAAELTRDPSSEGVKHAATCRASLPDAEAKEAAWQAVLHGTDLSNHVLRATADGFWRPEQRELLEPYVARFFAEFPAAIDARMPWEKMHLTAAMFPSLAVEARTAELAAEMLSADGLAQEFRRTAADRLDDLSRAVRVREAADTL
ncbi:aminopeptidase N [Phytomonospora endophytica]|uniref:Aminopeptidase N n=1 Tax=Phytomonospora endophytica TaxID=714109 RepID=A0A841FLH4_9ACTN|nr:aminopeptidase N [Phytomonospora endophytica]MBB6034037.1 aminopeptidase N [Phytomonospora endophytica]GIG71573.1 aminopeptidase [Phytomonospora endophytica]